MIFVDTNILSDILGGDQTWADWAFGQLGELSCHHDLVTNHIVIAELHLRDAFVPLIAGLCSDLTLNVQDLDWATSALAGAAFRDYRSRGGTAPKILADLLIGAHAHVLGASLLTRDAKGFRSYFPDLALITPETSHG